MYFGTKSYLKSNRNHTAKQALKLEMFGSKGFEIYTDNF
jgi:hypothetical protein